MAINPIAKPTVAPPRAPRWEYLTVTYNMSYGSATYEINGQKEGRLKNKGLHEALSLLGGMGWELVGIAGAEGKLYILKRPSFGAPREGEAKDPLA